MPQLIALENGLIALSFFAIAAMIFLGVFRDRTLGMNPLAIATGFIFFTCASGHAMHAEHFLVDPDIYNSDPNLWHLSFFDALTLAAGVGYLAQRRRYGIVIRGSTPMLEYQDRLQMAEALRDIGQDIAAQTDFDKLLKRVVMHARDLLHADYAAIVTVDESGKLRRQVAGVDADSWSDDAWNEATFLTDNSGRVTALSASGRPVVIEDLLSVSAAGWSE